MYNVNYETNKNEVLQMNYLIGLDIGTSAVKGVLLSEDGKVLNTVNGQFTYTDRDGARLMDPEAFCDTCFNVIKELASQKGDGRIAGICSCCASGNLLLLDENDKPTIPIIGWQTCVPMEEIENFHTKEMIDSIYKTVGWNLFGGMPLAYLTSIRIHRPELIDNAKMVVMSAEYMNFRITGKWGISHSMGTPFYLMDQEKGVYNAPLLKSLGIKEETLPPICDKGTVLGTALPEIAEKLGLDEDTKIVLGSFDHPSGALGSGVFDEGDMLLSCGTSWVEFFPVNDRNFALSTSGLVDRHMLKGTPYCVMKSLTSVTEKINALRNHFFGEISHKEFDGYIAEAPLGCNGLRFDFTEADHSKAEGFEKSDIARAIIESAAILLKNNLAELRECGLAADRITIIGGITNSKICTDVIEEVLELPLKVVNGQSAGAVGSALLAGVGVGLYEDEVSAFSTMIAHQN